MVQPIVTTKLVSPLRGGTCFKIIPLHVQTFIVLVQVTTIVVELVEGSVKSIMDQVELVDPPFTVLDSGVGPLEFLSTTLPLTPHLIGIGQKIILITNTLHALEVLTTTPIATFEETCDQQRTTTLIGLHILNQVELLEETNVEPIE